MLQLPWLKERRFNMRFTYAIFRTDQGKGYGCFAIEEEPNEQLLESVDNEQPKNRSYVVSASFCHPGDRNKFSKYKARMIAMQRVKSDKLSIFIRTDSKHLSELAEKYVCVGNNVPRWALKAFEKDLMFSTLESDNLA